MRQTRVDAVALSLRGLLLREANLLILLPRLGSAHARWLDLLHRLEPVIVPDCANRVVWSRPGWLVVLHDIPVSHCACPERDDVRLRTHPLRGIGAEQLHPPVAGTLPSVRLASWGDRA